MNLRRSSSNMEAKGATASAPATAAAAPKSKKQKSNTTTHHPSVAKMVNKAIESLNEKGGSSVRAIKKYIAANFMVDPEKKTVFIKKYLAKAVEEKVLLQKSGKGLTGSFKLASTAPKKRDIVKRHVTASVATKEYRKKNTKNTKRSSSKTKKPASKRQLRVGDRKSAEKKVSKTSTTDASDKAE